MIEDNNLCSWCDACERKENSDLCEECYNNFYEPGCDDN